MRPALTLAIRLALFIFTFSIEVRVRADILRPADTDSVVQLPLASAPLNQPEKCALLSPDIACAIKTGRNEQYRMKLLGSTVHMDRATSVIRMSHSEIRLLSGTVWIEAKGEFKVSTEFGVVHIPNGGELWVEKSIPQTELANIDGREAIVTISTISGDVEVSPRGAKSQVTIEPNCENTLSAVTKDGEAALGVPMAISFRAHLARWARLFPGTAKQFESAVAVFYSGWARAAERTAELHQQLYSRKVASIKSDEAHKIEILRQREEQKKLIREVFYKHTFEDGM